MTKNQLGLVFGLFLAILHAIWSLAVAAIPSQLQLFIDWIFKLHHLSLPMTITPFVLSNAIILVILTFIIGYIAGWIAGFLTRLVRK